MPVTAAGTITDSLGREWDPIKHPRDRKGKFIHVLRLIRAFAHPDDADAWSTGSVVKINDDGSIRMKVEKVAPGHDQSYVGQMVDVLGNQVENINEKAKLNLYGKPHVGTDLGHYDFEPNATKSFAGAISNNPDKVQADLQDAAAKISAGQGNLVSTHDKMWLATYAKSISDADPGSGKQHTDADYMKLLENLGVPTDVIDDTPDGMSGLKWLMDEQNATHSPGDSNKDTENWFDFQPPTADGALIEAKLHNSDVRIRINSDGTQEIIHPNGVVEQHDKNKGSLLLAAHEAHSAPGTGPGSDAPSTPKPEDKYDPAVLKKFAENMDTDLPGEFQEIKDDIKNLAMDLEMGDIAQLDADAELQSIHDKMYNDWEDTGDPYHTLGDYYNEFGKLIDPNDPSMYPEPPDDPWADPPSQPDEPPAPDVPVTPQPPHHSSTASGLYAKVVSNDELWAGDYNFKPGAFIALSANKNSEGTVSFDPASVRQVIRAQGPAYRLVNKNGEFEWYYANGSNNKGNVLADLTQGVDNDKAIANVVDEAGFLNDDFKYVYGDTEVRYGNLVPSEAAAISDYRNENGPNSYKKLNKALRNDEEISNDQYNAINIIDDVVGRSQTNKPLTVWRGISEDKNDSEGWDKLEASLVEGAVITDPAFMSTSRNKQETLDQFVNKGNHTGFPDARKVLLEIDLPEGSTAADVTAINTEFGNHGWSIEQEMLLPRDSKLKITSVEKTADGLVVKASVVDPLTDPTPIGDTNAEAPSAPEAPSLPDGGGSPDLVPDNAPSNAPGLDLTPDELQQVKYYIGHPSTFNDLSAPDHSDINELLRSGVELDALGAEPKKMVDAMDKAIAASTLKEPKTVFRGMSWDEEAPDWVTNIAPGDVIADKAYVSTSTNSGVSKLFTEGESALLFEVKLPEGTHALDVDADPDLAGGEKEIILARGTKFKVTKVTPGDESNNYLTHVEVTLDTGEEDHGQAGGEVPGPNHVDAGPGGGDTGGPNSGGSGSKPVTNEPQPGSTDWKNMVDAEGEFRYAPDGTKVRIGDKVTSLTDGLSGTIYKFEKNHDGAVVLGSDGKKRGRKISKLKIEKNAPEQKTAPLPYPNSAAGTPVGGSAVLYPSWANGQPVVFKKVNDDEWQSVDPDSGDTVTNSDHDIQSMWHLTEPTASSTNEYEGVNWFDTSSWPGWDKLTPNQKDSLGGLVADYGDDLPPGSEKDYGQIVYDAVKDLDSGAKTRQEVAQMLHDYAKEEYGFKEISLEHAGDMLLEKNDAWTVPDSAPDDSNSGQLNSATKSNLKQLEDLHSDLSQSPTELDPNWGYAYDTLGEQLTHIHDQVFKGEMSPGVAATMVDELADTVYPDDPDADEPHPVKADLVDLSDAYHFLGTPASNWTPGSTPAPNAPDLTHPETWDGYDGLSPWHQEALKTFIADAGDTKIPGFSDTFADSLPQSIALLGKGQYDPEKFGSDLRTLAKDITDPDDKVAVEKLAHAFDGKGYTGYDNEPLADWEKDLLQGPDIGKDIKNKVSAFRALIPKNFPGVKKLYPNMSEYQVKQFRNAGFALDDADAAQHGSPEWKKSTEKAIANLKNAGPDAAPALKSLQDILNGGNQPDTPAVSGVPVGSTYKTADGGNWIKGADGIWTHSDPIVEQTYGPGDYNYDYLEDKATPPESDASGVPADTKSVDDEAPVGGMWGQWTKQPDGSWKTPAGNTAIKHESGNGGLWKQIENLYKKSGVPPQESDAADSKGPGDPDVPVGSAVNAYYGHDYVKQTDGSWTSPSGPKIEVGSDADTDINKYAKDSSLIPPQGFKPKPGPHGVDSKGNAIYLGDTVKSTTDGLEGKVYKFESNGTGVVIIDSTGQKRARKMNKLVNTSADAAPFQAAQMMPSTTAGDSNAPSVAPVSTPAPKKIKPKVTLEPDPNSPWYGEDKKPVPPVKPDILSPSTWVPDDWMTRAEEHWKANTTAKHKTFDSTLQYTRWQKVANDGDLASLDSLKQEGFIPDDLYNDAKNMIDQINAAGEGEAQKWAADLKKYSQDVKEWNKANGIDPLAFPGAPKNATEAFMGGEADWTKAPTGTPSAVDALAAIRDADSALAARGVGIATDADQIEDFDVRLLKVIDTDGQIRIEAKFKMTAWAGDDLANVLNFKQGVTKTDGIYLNTRTTDQATGLPKYLDQKAYTRHGHGLDTYTWTDPDTGTKFKFTRATNGKTPLAIDATHHNVQMLMPAGATEETYQKALLNLGIKQATPAAPANIELYAKHKLASVFGGDTDTTTNKTGAALEQKLADVKSKYGVTTADLKLGTDSKGRIKIMLSDDARDKMQKYANIAAFTHNVSGGHDIDRWKSILIGGTSGLNATHVRWSEGQGGTHGMSSGPDMHSGGGDFIYFRPNHGTITTASGNGQVVMHPKAAMRRLDIYGNQSDTGTGKHSDGKQVYDIMKGNPYEIVFKHGVPVSDMWYVTLPNSTIRQQLIQELKNHGIDEINGVPVEQFVLTSGMAVPSMEDWQWSTDDLPPAIEAALS